MRFTEKEGKEKGIPLSGGNINDSVVRIGETVRRSLTSASPTVHALLLHLEAKGFASSPRFLGIDDNDRETLSFFEGKTGIPRYIWLGDEPLITVATMLRQYHEATADFEPPDSTFWAYTYPDASRHEVICHNDFAPYNWVYQNEMPYAVIDFDLAGPGPRVRDVAYAAYWMTPLSFNSKEQAALAEVDVQNGGHRLHLFCETYGILAESALLDMVEEVLTCMASEDHARQVVGDVAAAKLMGDGHLAHWKREAAAFHQNRLRIESNL